VASESTRVALLGFGTVGQSVARILCSGEVPQVHLTHIFNRNIASKRVDWVPASVCWTESIEDILASDTRIVIEVVGGIHPAFAWVKGALLAGKSVVTANKQLMAHHGPELIDLARSRGLEVRFEASVAGGIPVMRALQEGLAGDRLVEVRGILNGTCAYILSRMQSDAISFADALDQAD
jgi:homoserine dehydrogenase